MKKKIALIGGAILLGLVVLSLALSSQNGGDDKTDAVHRAEIHEFIDNRALFLRSERSPVDPMHRLKIESLDWFSIDKRYRVEARLERTPGVTERPGPETEGPKVAGIVHFHMNGAPQKLTAYWDAPDSFDRLFIAFKDATNGGESYGGGRYLKPMTPKNGASLVLDFNKAHNPYCAYDPNFTCPLPPPENELPFPVQAGEKNYLSPVEQPGA